MWRRLQTPVGLTWGPVSGVSVNLEDGLRSKPVTHQRSELCLALDGRVGEELGKAPLLLGRARAGPAASFPEWVWLPHCFEFTLICPLDRQ